MHHKSMWTAHKKELRKYIKKFDLALLDDLGHAQSDGVRELVQRINVIVSWCCEEEGCQVADVSEKYVRQHG